MKNSIFVLLRFSKVSTYFILGFFISSFTYFIYSYSEENVCSSSCLGLMKDLKEREEEINRIQNIRERNERFILSLDPDQSSQKMKAESNIRVAQRRVEAIEKDSQKIKEDLGKKKCTLCPSMGG